MNIVKDNLILREMRVQTKEFEHRLNDIDRVYYKTNSKVGSIEQRVQDLYQRIIENDKRLNEIKNKSNDLNIEIDISNAIMEHKEYYLNNLNTLYIATKETIEKVTKERDRLANDFLIKNDEFNKWQDEHSNYDAIREIKVKEEIELDELKLINLQMESKMNQTRTTQQKSKELDMEIKKWKEIVEDNEYKLNSRYEQSESLIKEINDTTEQINTLQNEIESIQKKIEEHQMQQQQQQLLQQQPKKRNQKMLPLHNNQVQSLKSSVKNNNNNNNTTNINATILNKAHLQQTQQQQHQHQQQPSSNNVTKMANVTTSWNKQSFLSGQHNFLVPIQHHQQQNHINDITTNKINSKSVLLSKK
ncbi:hypothetical protein PPL_02361 [Heterostelium album PN500]|uniref:Uncharacterized protein n=1 Tax=Heterostelium pallidum (strain ATCC 26659 / Pp 5 / PN500) TaxID=670386 RepID=D3B234_HETP5|nr:hypothetical protein PPL_02361 [Heterostelium album PN500]EFA85358.1 hypothetical protein PPL_02361 [Heterostelium album PN500]|eukprot:XP_020437467.1 hypothetical protein PPL_02361 [Heterostelium album PN500]